MYYELVFGFMNDAQSKVVEEGMRGEECEYFNSVIKKLSDTIQNMPVTYEQEGKGDEAVAFLHYFKGGCDVYVTERDVDEEQNQMFGLVDMGFGPELGYISLDEILNAGLELDFHFESMTVAEIMKG